MQKFTSTQTRKTFRLDLGDYTGRDDFLNSFKTKYGFSLEGLCDVLADAGPSTLILDDIPAPDADSGSGQQP